MAFDPERLCDELRETGRVLVTTLRGVDPAVASERPAPDRWSLLEIAAHLLDEEREDFRARIASTLDDPSEPWPPLDPESWVTARDYASKDYLETVEAFEDERAASIGWLTARVDTDWSTAYVHPKVGPVAAGELFAAWVAHDLLHLAQIARTRAELLDGEVAPYSTRYANP